MFVSIVSERTQVKNRITYGIISIILGFSLLMTGISQGSALGSPLGSTVGTGQSNRVEQIQILKQIQNPNGFSNAIPASASGLEAAGEVKPGDLIRFHVIANSDSEEDQLLKYNVRDEILKKVAPRVANSTSLEESRAIIKGMEAELLETTSKVIADWGKNYKVSMDYGVHNFPAKSYGNIVLPSGEYEAVKIKIGEAQGANWWCVLFPPICFVNVEESTAVPVDGKPGVPLDSSAKQKNMSAYENSEKSSILPENVTYKGKKVGFFFERFF